MADSQVKEARGTWDSWVDSKESLCNSQECSIPTQKVKQEASEDKQRFPTTLQKELLRTWEQGLDLCSMGGIEIPCPDVQGWSWRSQEALPGLELMSTCS